MFCNASVARKGHWLFGKRRRQHVCVIQLQIRAPLVPVAGLLFRLRVNTEREGWADVFCLDAQPPDNTQKNMQIYTPTHTVRSDFHSLKNICIYIKKSWVKGEGQVIWFGNCDIVKECEDRRHVSDHLLCIFCTSLRQQVLKLSESHVNVARGRNWEREVRSTPGGLPPLC